MLVKTNLSLCLLLAALLLSLSQAFTLPAGRHRIAKTGKSVIPIVHFPRGGEQATQRSMISSPQWIESVVVPALKSGPLGVPVLAAIAATAVVPLTMYKQLWSISVGYGASIFLVGLSLLLAFRPVSLEGKAFAGVLMFYGLRLASYLFLREVTRKDEPQGMKKDKPILQRLPLAVSVSLFYAFLTTPALYACRNLGTVASSSNKLLVTQCGLGVAYFGAALEAVADLHKYFVKQKSSSDDKLFDGPTTWSYRICRHPNYLGEILCWTGVFVGGVPSFQKSVIAWVSSVLGLYGIVSIMRQASNRLDARQEEKYKSQEKYDTWKAKVKSSLLPFL